MTSRAPRARASPRARGGRRAGRRRLSGDPCRRPPTWPRTPSARGCSTREGMTVWNAQWYGGHHVLGYSMLFAPLAAWPGPRGSARSAPSPRPPRSCRSRARRAAPAARDRGDLAVRGRRAQQRRDRADAVHARHRARRRRAWLCAERDRPAWRVAAAVLALACVLASPVAGAFLVLAAAARAAGDRRPRARSRRAAVLGAAGDRRRRHDGRPVPGGRRRPLRGDARSGRCSLVALAGRAAAGAARRGSARCCTSPCSSRRS